MYTHSIYDLNKYTLEYIYISMQYNTNIYNNTNVIFLSELFLLIICDHITNVIRCFVVLFLGINWISQLQSLAYSSLRYEFQSKYL